MDKAAPSPVIAAGAAALYGVSAVAIAFVNKAVMSVYGFKVLYFINSQCSPFLQLPALRPMNLLARAFFFCFFIEANLSP